MSLSDVSSRLRSRLRREASTKLARRPLAMRNEEPLISFTFDDFPRSALLQGGSILRACGLKGTFFASFGLMGHVGPTGEMFSPADLEEFVRENHELGCHTYDHCHAWETAPSDFEASILRNRFAVEKYLPGVELKTLSYPISCPRPATKRRTARYFSCCRGGGQTFNCGTLDLNYLSGFFIEQSRHDFDTIKRVIAQNAREKGWLIFATHDISDNPTRFGCTPILFEKIVRCSVQSGAKTLSVAEAVKIVGGASAESCLCP
jgi:peptidoglycan/xylan/chitin deacetylase (PgdA/CDA1 family)